MTDEPQPGHMYAPPPVASAPAPGPPPGWWYASDGRWYPPPAPGAPVGYPQAWQQPAHSGTNGLAVASMVLGILWLYWIGSILALIFGYVALSQIRRAGHSQTGRGMAIAGIALGWVGVGLALLAVVLAVNSGSG